MSRDRFKGPLRIGETITLREDFYSATWLHFFHVEVLAGAPTPKKPEENPPAANTVADVGIDD